MIGANNDGVASAAETTGALPLRKVIPLGRKANIPPPGINTGRFLDVTVFPEDKDANGKARLRMQLDVELEALNAAGKPFTVSKVYNLAARGIAVLSEDLKDWAGVDVVPEGGGEFDASVFLGKSVRVELNNSKQGKKFVTSITKFLPVEAALQPA